MDGCRYLVIIFLVMDAPQFPKLSEFGTDQRVQLVDETGRYTFTDPKDGMGYEFDTAKGAWFPMWNESLVEQQQSIYNEENEKGVQGKPQTEKTETRKRENTSVYISGLPLDTTRKELVEYFSQCGTIMPDILTNEPRIKLYRGPDGTLKGDGLVTYFKAPSVQLAIDILDDTQLRPGNSNLKIKVQEAKFDAKTGEKGQEQRKRPRVDPKVAQKRIGQLEKKLDWFEGAGEVEDRHKRTVVLKHMFTPAEMREDITLELDLIEDVREECERIGTVTSVKVYDLSEEGVISAKFKDEVAARACVKVSTICCLLYCRI